MALDVYKDWLGIPDGPRPPDHYTLLRLVQFEDDAEKIRKNYTKLNAHVRKYAGGQYSNQSQDLLNELARAMLCLTDPDRKREYDEGLGRDFEDAGGAAAATLDGWLVEQEIASRDQLREAESFADARGLSLRDAVVQLKLTDIETATRGYAQELGRPFVDLAEMVPDDSVLDQVPRNLVKRHQCIPLFVDDDVLLVACAYEPGPELEEEMQLRYGTPMRAVIATPLAVNQAIAQYFAPGMRDEAAAEQSAAASGKKGAAAKRTAKTRKSAGPASDDEKQQQKLVQIIILCWSVIGLVAFNQFVLKPLTGLTWQIDVLAVIVALGAGWFVWSQSRKK